MTEINEQEIAGDFSMYFGPAHPGSGNFSIKVEMRGERVLKATADPGYLHRGFEKLMEYREPMQNAVLSDRVCVLEPLQWNLVHAEAVDYLMDYEVPERAKYIRVILAELSRIQSHFIWYAAMSLGTGFMTGFNIAIGYRDYILDVLNLITGGRVYPAGYICPGGVRKDLPEKAENKILELLPKIEYMRKFALKQNPAWLARFKEIGTLTKEEAIKFGAVGPILRGCGVESDVRRDDPYEIYDELEFDVPVMDEGDAYARFTVGMQEIEESMKIITQSIDRLPKGEVKTPNLKPIVQFQKAEGEIYIRNELSRGEGAFYMVATGQKTPYRVKIRGPSFTHMIPILEHLLTDVAYADVPAIYWSMYQCPADVDR
ncbi:MAG: NADH-quinone oxidoreductase subunit D [Candidatus Heimdallarchaeota archaeon]|nr:NADH-quinone oxidoreductase subunit D [Candidatus Heimdallarchaeota archaeon]MCG3255426.1 NADH-quinone oxidoreductase subunit D [Candidatus Heimdallarchaeota archaeon]MCK4610499.1 NADH-quinone oxidoreductase subunit D [Candidatus Heimdallarchaeota archaeon]